MDTARNECGAGSGLSSIQPEEKPPNHERLPRLSRHGWDSNSKDIDDFDLEDDNQDQDSSPRRKKDHQVHIINEDDFGKFQDLELNTKMSQQKVVRFNDNDNGDIVVGWKKDGK
eukprot:10840887-Ditylum_brightwellii.AAC.1